MKVLCTDHVDVSSPAERVYANVADIGRWPVWFSSVVNAQQTDGRPLALGADVALCLNAGRRRWRENFEVTRLVPGAFLSLEGELSAARRIDFRIEQRGARTRIAAAIGYPVFGGAIAAAADAVFKRHRVRADLRDSLLRLKGLLEERVELSALGEETVDAPSTEATEPAGAV